MLLRVDGSTVSARSPATSACTCASAATTTSTHSKCKFWIDANQRQDDYGKNSATHSLISSQVPSLDALKAGLGSASTRMKYCGDGMIVLAQTMRRAKLKNMPA
jgi:hypothetical protein